MFSTIFFGQLNQLLAVSKPDYQNIEMTFLRNVLPNMLLKSQNAVLVVKKTPQNFYQCGMYNFAWKSNFEQTQMQKASFLPCRCGWIHFRMHAVIRERERSQLVIVGFYLFRPLSCSCKNHFLVHNRMNMHLGRLSLILTKSMVEPMYCIYVYCTYVIYFLVVLGPVLYTVGYVFECLISRQLYQNMIQIKFQQDVPGYTANVGHMEKLKYSNVLYQLHFGIVLCMVNSCTWYST